MTSTVEQPEDVRAALRQFQDFGRGLVPKGMDVLAEFLDERRAAARLEEDE